MKGLSKALVSRLLIVTGCICIAAPLCYEAIRYPWSAVNDAHVNEIVLPDPDPPDFEYVDYRDVPAATPRPTDSTPRAAENDSISADTTEDQYDEAPVVLPGEDTTVAAESTVDTVASEKPSPKYVLLGVVKIPRISISENMFEGTLGQMKYGVGHLEGSAMPGEKGNVVLAAHRVSSGRQPFRHLDKMQNGDIITVRLDDTEFSYEVFDMFIVAKEDTWVLKTVADEPYLMTLVTCDPVIYPTNRPNRLIVRARLLSAPGSEGESGDAAVSDAGVQILSLVSISIC